MAIDTNTVSSPRSIGLDWTDEKLVLFLLMLKNGDPLPSNVVIDKDPFAIIPWDAPASTWFLCNFDDTGSSERQKIRNMRGGYWKEKENNTLIPWGDLGAGKKIFWEFYVGFEPSGDRTAWQMLEYYMEQKAQEVNEKQAHDFSSLCRIYLLDIDAVNLGDGNNHFHVGENSIDSLEAELLRLSDDKGWEHSEFVRKSQIPCGEEQGLLSGAGGGQKELDPDEIVDLHASFDFSNGDFLELNDFEKVLSSPSSSSDNSTCLSGTSDECFDSMAFLEELGCENIPTTESREFSTGASLEMDQVSTELIPTAIQGSGNDILKEDIASSSAKHHKVEGLIPSSSGILSTSKPLKSGPGETSRLKRAASRGSSSEGSGSSHGSQGSSAPNESSHRSGRSSVNRIKRLGMKYCCLNPF